MLEAILTFMPTAKCLVMSHIMSAIVVQPDSHPNGYSESYRSRLTSNGCVMQMHLCWNPDAS